MIRNILSKISQEHGAIYEEKKSSAIKDYREKVESTVSSVVLKRGRVQCKIFGKDRHDQEMVNELQDEILKEINIEDKVSKLLVDD